MSCGTNNEYYFFRLYIPGVFANRTAAGFGKIIIVENNDFDRILFLQWEFDRINNLDDGAGLVTVYPSTRLKNFNNFFMCITLVKRKKYIVL